VVKIFFCSLQHQDPGFGSYPNVHAMTFTRPSLNAKLITDVCLVSRFRVLASVHSVTHIMSLIGVQSQKQFGFHLVGIYLQHIIRCMYI